MAIQMSEYEKKLREEIQPEINGFTNPLVRGVANKFCDLSNNDRLDIMALACSGCGTLDKPCNCQDED